MVARWLDLAGGHLHVCKQTVLWQLRVGWVLSCKSRLRCQAYWMVTSSQPDLLPLVLPVPLHYHHL